MSPRFLAMWGFIKEWEGVTYENDKDDPGGETKFGLDKRSHPSLDIKNLTEQQAVQVYWDSYWQKNQCEEKPHPMGEVYYNCCVNCGAGRAIQLLKESGGDASRFLDAQAGFYKRLVASRPKSAKYLKGWLNRIAALRKHLGI